MKTLSNELQASEAIKVANPPAAIQVRRAAPPAVKPPSSKLRRRLATAGWWIASVSIFVGVWELCWLVGWVDPLMMPPPHIFLSNIADQFKFFDAGSRVGSDSEGASVVAVLQVIGWTTLRVVLGLGIGFTLAVATGILNRYNQLFGKLTLPTLTLLAPISPVAWLPVAIFLFGIGDVPAVFMVFISVYFVIVLATLAQIDNVPVSYIQVARILGATKRQIFRSVVLPAILPGLFMTLRLNLFAAWMAVLIAEAVGVGSGLGQIVMMARNTFNSSLVFFSMTLIGLLGFLLDYALRAIQQRLLWWVGPASDRKAR